MTESAKDRDARLEAGREEFSRWLRSYDEMKRKPRIHTKTSRFVKKAGIAKLPCVCGVTKVHMHHTDYDQPLKVAFLCAKCHRHEHLGWLNKPFVVHDLRDLAVQHIIAFA